MNAPESESSSLDAAAEAMAQILDRCVWSRQQTHESLVTYLIEESYELVEAIESGTPEDVREELGDVLWQVLFHAEIARRSGEGFSIADVAADLHAKMIRRHPHVFGSEVAETPEDVRRLWSAAKAAEKRERTSVLDGIPPGMPALALADKMLGRAATAGVAAPLPAPGAATEAELGEQLLALVAAGRELGLDPERALRDRLRLLAAAVRRQEQQHDDE
ncbi:MazG family protein [Gryllotalpicola sp.]|uniref:MazG family protein n=1 Tax=Gryllotalpicola sp. TaxID=1932787 RepID=UPI002607679D|nr:MazG family protein [Gryllotalpicola sp.]